MQMQITIYYEDTDAQGIVYHANYLKYFERFRTQWLMDHGHWDKITASGAYFVVKSLQLDYLAPAYLGDQLLINGDFKQLRPTLALWQQTIHKGPQCICRGQFEIAYINAKGRPQKLPEDLFSQAL